MGKEIKLKEAFDIVLRTTRGEMHETYQKRIAAADKLEKFLRDMKFGAALPPKRKEIK